MADKEINIKFTANTDDAKKGIAEVTNELEKMSTSGSGKAADELDKVTEAADKASKMTDELSKKYEAWGESVKKAEGVSRLINANQFKDAETRDMILAKHQEELDKLLKIGTELAASMREIGIEPRQLNSFVTYADILTRAKKEFEIALNNQERLLNQPKVPAAPPIRDDPDDPDGNEFKRRYANYAADIAEYQKQLEITVAATDKFKEALRAEYAALDENAEGYLQKKQLLERLISQSERYTAAQGNLTSGIKTQIAAFKELYEETTKKQSWEKGLAELDKLAPSVEKNSQKVRVTMQNAIGLQNTYNNAIIKGQDAEMKGWQKVQASMDVAGKSREELIRLVEEYGKALANAKTKEEYEAAAAGITAARKQLTLLTREANLTGAAIGASATSVQGLTTSLARAGIQGRLTFKGLTAAVQTFAKSTLVLAGIQFAWEALSKIWEKVKGDLFGVADAEERAAERAEALAEAAKNAGDELRNAQVALAAWNADQERAEAAKQFADALKRQNDYYIEQVRLVDEATAALLRQAAVNAKEDEHEIALERLRLQEQKMKGLIDEFEYQEKLVDLETRAAEIRREANVESKALAKLGKSDQLTAAKNALSEAEMTATEELGLSPAELKAMIAAYQKDEAKIQHYEGKYKEREKLEERIKTAKEQVASFRSSGKNYDAMMIERHILPDMEERLSELNDVLKEVDGLIIRSTQTLEKIPDQIKDAPTMEIGLAEYSKDYAERKKANEAIEKQQEKFRNEVEKLQKEYDRAALEWENAVDDAALAASQQGQLSEQKKANIRLQRDNEKARAETEKKIDAAKREIQSLNIVELKKAAREIKNQAKTAGLKTPEGKNLLSLAAVYQDAYEARVNKNVQSVQRFIPGIMNEEGRLKTSQGKAARAYVSAGLAPTGTDETRVVEGLNKIAQEAITDGKVKDSIIKRMKSAADAVMRTSGKDDDIAFERVVTLLSEVIKATEKNAKKARKHERTLEALKKRTANIDA